MIIYLVALLMDMMCFVVGFAVLYGMGERHMPEAQCAWIGAAMQIGYMPFSFIVGRILSRRNARVILLVGTVGATAVAVSALFCTAFPALFVLFLLFGMFAAFFFNSFQTYMRGETPPGGLGQAVGNYTVAWSTGIALGFIVSGSMYRLGPWGLMMVALAGGGTILSAILFRRSRPHDAASAEEHVEQGPAGSRPVDSSYVWVGWVMIFAACFVQRPIQTFFPALCADQGISPQLTSLPLFLMMIVQAVCGFGMRWLRGTLYRRTALWVVQVSGAAALAFVWKFPSYASYVIGFAVLGVYSGFVFFCAVDYASNDFAHRSRNVGVNEFMVGAGSLAGIYGCEVWLSRGADRAGLYAACGAALLILTVVQLLLARTRRG